MHTTFLLVCIFISMNLLCTVEPASEKEKAELQKIKSSPEFQKARAKVMEALSGKIDSYVLDTLRKKKASAGGK
uniref:Uncharacterized protein n=1 Tax=Trichobilharzia regenti TaxID=157069 RepID=A0AA85KHQ9_TRIRE|nr:unnamed protein product [Trichobilharzia regenti]CAH8849362.1 unnamed protein product [Trichobilharzia regenti]